MAQSFWLRLCQGNTCALVASACEVLGRCYIARRATIRGQRLDIIFLQRICYISYINIYKYRDEIDEPWFSHWIKLTNVLVNHDVITKHRGFSMYYSLRCFIIRLSDFPTPGLTDVDPFGYKAYVNISWLYLFGGTQIYSITRWKHRFYQHRINS